MNAERPAVEEVLRLLAQRGHRQARTAAAGELLTPSSSSPAELDACYETLAHYSFRIFLRDAIAPGRRLVPEALSRHCTSAVAAEYLEVLERWRWLVRDAGGELVWARSPPATFGPTLEWFVCEVLARELAIPAARGVQLVGEGPGGDYDVVGCAGGRLLFLEVKSSPPKHIERGEVAGFLARRKQLGADLSIFFVDTNLRMKDKVVSMFEEALARPLARVSGETFALGPGAFVTNSQRDVAENLALCLRSYFGSSG